MSSDRPVERPSYGDARRPWHPEFIDYMYRILKHPNYAGMPCTVDEDGKIDWTIPSNRPKGSKNWDGNDRRREWWRQKANTEGISIEGSWLSKTAKKIHPFGQKPCQTCGRIMRLAYAYPTSRTLARINRYLPDDSLVAEADLLAIEEVIDHAVKELGEAGAVEAVKGSFPRLDDVEDVSVHELNSIISERHVRGEARGWLSPGAMSNAPDRLDGFHTYNLCCRQKHDTGRSLENLKTYGADRRAFENWCEGDWSAANSLMTAPGFGRCPRCGTEAQLTADHIGPISLGFVHSPHFDAVCLACNSSKNNRMSFPDIQALLTTENSGEQVVSWHARHLWDACKDRVFDDVEALLLSRLMRVSQHHYLILLSTIKGRGLSDVLLQLLRPEFAEYRTQFVGLDPQTLQYERIERTPRQSSYARSHASRMVRIAFEALDDYASKTKRNLQLVSDSAMAKSDLRVKYALEEAEANSSEWREELTEILAQELSHRDARLVLLFDGKYKPDVDFGGVKEAIDGYMAALAGVLARRFESGESLALADALDKALNQTDS
ncbi:MAG: Alw26I/Eco31I/Esp3I family type II restriction endonuclease [Actinomycetota bacterium]